MTILNDFTAMGAAPSQLKTLPPLRIAIAQKFLADLATSFDGVLCVPAFGPIDSHLEQAISDLLAAGLIEVGIHYGELAVRRDQSQVQELGPVGSIDHQAASAVVEKEASK
jgi:hypothetical protein